MPTLLPLFLCHSESQCMQNQEENLYRKRIIDEVTLAIRRIPRFPGSINFLKAKWLIAPPDLHCVVGIDDRVLKEALKVCRGVAAKILKEALQAGRLSIRYSTNFASHLPDFIDQNVIKAAGNERVSELLHLSFNAQAKGYI